ncbi:MAG: hypothetical protein ACFB20_01835 [Opitutales bacterium]
MPAQLIFIIKFAVIALPVLFALAVVCWPMQKMRAGVQKVGGLQGVEIPIGLIVFIKAGVLLSCAVFALVATKFLFPQWL